MTTMLTWGGLPPLETTEPETMPEVDQMLDGIPVYTDKALYEHLFGDNIPLNPMVVVQKGQKWLEAHNAMAVMATDNRMTWVARAKQIGRTCLVTLQPNSPFILQPPTNPRAC